MNNEIGYLETIKFPEVDIEVEATADTGNGMYNVLDAKDIKIIDDIVSFKMNGKKVVKKLKGLIDVNVGGIRDFIDKRPLVKFDIEFNKTLFKNVTFTLDDRPKNLTPVLLCRDFLIDIGVIINPKYKFTLDNKEDFKTIRQKFI